MTDKLSQAYKDWEREKWLLEQIEHLADLEMWGLTDADQLRLDSYRQEYKDIKII